MVWRLSGSYKPRVRRGGYVPAVMPTINHLAVLVTVVASQILGFLWYSVLFGRPWARGYRLPDDAVAKNPPISYLVTILAAAVFGYAVAVLRGLLEVSGIGGGLALGALLWLGLVGPRYLLHAVFGRIAAPSVLIDLGFDLVIAAVTGAILAVWLPG